MRSRAKELKPYSPDLSSQAHIRQFVHNQFVIVWKPLVREFIITFKLYCKFKKVKASPVSLNRSGGHNSEVTYMYRSTHAQVQNLARVHAPMVQSRDKRAFMA